MRPLPTYESIVAWLGGTQTCINRDGVSFKPHTLRSEAGRKAALIAGLKAVAQQELTVTDTDPSWLDLVRVGSLDSRGELSLKTYSYECSPLDREWDTIPTAAELIADYESRRATKEAEKAAEAAEYEAAARAVLSERKTTGEGEYVKPDWPYRAPESVTESPEARAWEAELAEQRKATKAERLAREEAAKAEKAAKAEEAAKAEAERRASLGLMDLDCDFPVSENCLAKVPVWESHSRGKNWLARITSNPTAPGGLEREFATKARGGLYYVLPDLAPGDAVEFGADYYTGKGRKQSERWYGFVVRVDRDDAGAAIRLILRKSAGGKTAIKDGAKFAAAATAAETE